MFTNFFSSFKVVFNISNIKNILTKSFVVIQKLIDFINAIKDEITNDKFTQYVPLVLSTLGGILSVFAKIAPIFGIQIPSLATPKLSSEDAKTQLDSAVNDLLSTLND